MNKTDLKVWLARHNMTQGQLAQKLGITSQVITKYNQNDRYPVIFQWAIKGVEASLTTTAAEGKTK